jgi:hypothetical protein
MDAHRRRSWSDNATEMKLAIVSHHLGETNRNLAAVRIDGVEVQLVPPERALGLLGPGDVALSRLDVRETLEAIAGLRSRRSLPRSCSSPGSAVGAKTSSFAAIAPSSSGG